MEKEKEKKYSFSTPEVLQTYKDIIDINARLELDTLFENDGHDYALAVFQTMFRYATKTIKIMCGSMDNNFTSNDGYLNALDGFLKRKNTTLNILMNNTSERKFKQSKVYLEVIKNHASKVNIRITHDYCFRVIDEKRQEVHFSIADDHMFRFEVDIKNRKAECNFGNKDITAKLSKSFDDIFDKEYVKPISL